MRFLADECCDFAAVRALRAHGHDVLAVCEFQHGSVDKDVMDLALIEERILLTEDKDFGWLHGREPLRASTVRTFLDRYNSPSSRAISAASYRLHAGDADPDAYGDGNLRVLGQGCPEQCVSFAGIYDRDSGPAAPDPFG